MAPNAAAPRLDRANQLIVAGDDKKAQLDVDYVLGLQPRNAGATYLNGVLMVRAGKYADAATELQKLGPVLGRFPRAMYFQALAAANLGQTEVAVDFASKYVGRVPNDPDGVRLLARTQLTAQRPERAVEVLSKAVSGGMSDPQTLDLLGRAYSMMGRTPEAIQTLKKASELAPGDAQILTHLASSQMQQGDASNARDSLEKSVQIAPNAPNTGEALVAAALGAGDLDKADEALAALRSRVGDTESVGILTGMVRLGRLDLDGGRAAFAATLKQFPDSINAKLNLAKVLILQSRRPEGEALLKEILLKDPTNLPTLSTYIQILVNDNQYQAAIEAVEAARKAAPTNRSFTAMQADLIVRSGDPRRAVAMLLVMRGNEDLPPVLLGALARAQAAAGLTDEAKKTYRDILVATPTDMDARRAQVELLLRNKEMDAAKAALKDALDSSPGNLGVMSAWVQLEAQTNGIDAALKLADEMRKNSANLPNSVVVKGDALMQAKRFPEAANAFLEEFRLQPTGPLVMRLANALVASSREDDAYKVLKDWKAQHPDDVDSSQLMGLLDVKAKRYPEATANLQQVLAKKPGDTIALNNLAWIYQLNKDPRARALAQRAYLQAPSPETGDTLGWIMVQSGESKGAVSLLQQASNQRPADMAIKYHLAAALKDTGQKDDAVKLLQPIVAGREDFDDKAAARKLLEELTGKK
jgi:putative PEP-CTERM system TPR-repeat lipoprotein